MNKTTAYSTHLKVAVGCCNKAYITHTADVRREVRCVLEKYLKNMSEDAQRFIDFEKRKNIRRQLERKISELVESNPNVYITDVWEAPDGVILIEYLEGARVRLLKVES